MDIDEETDQLINDGLKEYDDVLDTIERIDYLGYRLPGEYPTEVDAEFVKRYAKNVEVAETGLSAIRKDIIMLYFADRRSDGFTRKEAEKEIGSFGVSCVKYITFLIQRGEIDNRKMDVEQERRFRNAAEYCITEEGKLSLTKWLDNNDKERNILEKLKF